MELRPELILTTVIKSLGDNVIPAIDPDNAPARQQAQLSIALLEILKSRLPLMYRYDRHDLKSFVELGETLASSGSNKEATRNIERLCSEARELLGRARADPGEMLERSKDLRRAISVYVDDVRETGDEHTALKVDRIVVASAEELTLRERAWMLPFGFEADPAIVPDLETLLDPVR